MVSVVEMETVSPNARSTGAEMVGECCKTWKRMAKIVVVVAAVAASGVEVCKKHRELEGCGGGRFQFEPGRM